MRSQLDPDRDRSARSIGRWACLILAFGQAAALCGQSAHSAEPPEGLLPREIVQVLLADPLPQIAVDPAGRFALLVHERRLLPIERLAEPVVELVGRRINPETVAAHAPRDYYRLTLIDLSSGDGREIAIPRNAVIGFPSWAPDGSRFAFTVTRAHSHELWIGEPVSARAEPWLGSVSAARGLPCVWMADARHLLCKQASRSAVTDSKSRRVEPWAGRAPQPNEIGQPVLLGEGLTRELLESQLLIVDTISHQRYRIGSPAAFENVTPAPAGAFVLVTRLVEPYPEVSTVGAGKRAVEVWDRFGNVVQQLPQDARAVGWIASEPATLSWVSNREGRDRLIRSPPPYSDTTEVFTLPHRFSSLHWIGDSARALIGDWDANSRQTNLWYVDLDANEAGERLLIERANESLLAPVTAPNIHGVSAIVEHESGFYMHGETTSAGRRTAFLDYYPASGGEARRIWESGADSQEQLVDVLSADASLLLTRRESAKEPPNYWIGAPGKSEMYALTRFASAASRLADSRLVPLHYRRNDGQSLTASLYLPPGYDGESQLPLIVWAYPREVVATSDTGAIANDERYLTFERAFRLFFLLRGYAVLDEVAMPIVGKEGEANDSFIEQVVANADAAIRAAGGTGFVDSARVGIAGHSYGAFTVANLLAHSNIFSAGAALSGAYNRTLTPFGFQTERRTLWEAPETYLAMSPLLFSDRVEAPLLLVHGLNDDNAGTSPLQSKQFYEAIRGNGGDVELLLLPWEGHSYRARESVLKTAAEMLNWFDRHLKAERTKPAEKLGFRLEEAGASLRPPLIVTP